MSNMPIITGKNLINKLLKSGYIVLRIKGSHVFVTHNKYPKQSAVIPNTTKDLPLGTLSSIRRQLKLTKEEFVNLLS